MTKKSKSVKQGSDDITLPLMDKNQGQQITACIPSPEFYQTIIYERDEKLMRMRKVSSSSGNKNLLLNIPWFLSCQGQRNGHFQSQTIFF